MGELLCPFKVPKPLKQLGVSLWSLEMIYLVIIPNRMDCLNQVVMAACNMTLAISRKIAIWDLLGGWGFHSSNYEWEHMGLSYMNLLFLPLPPCAKWRFLPCVFWCFLRHIRNISWVWTPKCGSSRSCDLETRCTTGAEPYRVPAISGWMFKVNQDLSKRSSCNSCIRIHTMMGGYGRCLRSKFYKWVQVMCQMSFKAFSAQASMIVLTVVSFRTYHHTKLQLLMRLL